MVGMAVATIEGVAVSFKAGAVPGATVAVARNTGVGDTLSVAAIGIAVWVGETAGVARDVQAAIIRVVNTSSDHVRGWFIFMVSPIREGRLGVSPPSYVGRNRAQCEPRFLAQPDYFISVMPAGKLPVRSLREAWSNATERLKLWTAWALPSLPGVGLPSAPVPHITPLTVR